MQTKIIIFGRLAEIVKSSTITLHDIGCTDDLKVLLFNQYPYLAESDFLIAVDQEVITENTQLKENSTIALLPPFSGG